MRELFKADFQLTPEKKTCTRGNEARVCKTGCSVSRGLDIQRVKIFSDAPTATASRCQQPEIQMIFKAIFKNGSRLHC